MNEQETHTEDTGAREEVEQSGDNSVQCPSCYHINPPGSTSCNGCGKRLY